MMDFFYLRWILFKLWNSAGQLVFFLQMSQNSYIFLSKKEKAYCIFRYFTYTYIDNVKMARCLPPSWIFQFYNDSLCCPHNQFRIYFIIISIYQLYFICRLVKLWYFSVIYCVKDIAMWCVWYFSDNSIKKSVIPFN